MHNKKQCKSRHSHQCLHIAVDKAINIKWKGLSLDFHANTANLS